MTSGADDAARGPAADAAAEPWPTTPEAAVEVQRRLRARVETADRLGPVRRVAGIDVAYAPARDLTWAAVALLSWPALELEQSVLACRPTGFPYVPGLLSFREIPAMLDALSMLAHAPDLVFVDGHGIAHPRRIGIATHLGVLTDLPTIGVAKSRLVGRHDEPDVEAGAAVPLVHRGETVGAVLRSRRAVAPLFVSPGHRIGLDTALGFVRAAGRGLRLPEPTRIADLLSHARPK